ncbi:DUF4806 domain-containing protein, partial [Aphis craccivora]
SCKLKSIGTVEAAKLLKEITSSTPTRASKYRKVFKKQSAQAPKKLSGEDALAVIIDAKLSREDQTNLCGPDFKQIVNRNQVTIKYEIKNIQERLDLILIMQEKILDKLIKNQTIIDYTECNYEEFLTPMESDEELEPLKDKIKTNLAYRKSVVTELSRLMGQNLSETVRKIMQKFSVINCFHSTLI